MLGNDSEGSSSAALHVISDFNQGSAVVSEVLSKSGVSDSASEVAEEFSGILVVLELLDKDKVGSTSVGSSVSKGVKVGDNGSLSVVDSFLVSGDFRDQVGDSGVEFTASLGLGVEEVLDIANIFFELSFSDCPVVDKGLEIITSCSGNSDKKVDNVIYFVALLDKSFDSLF
jgi:hypothetical protein